MSKILLSEAIHPEGMEILRQAGEVVVAPDPAPATLAAMVADADALVVRSSPLPAMVIEAGANLKVIGRHGIGVDNIDLEAANRCGVPVVNTPDANSLSVAEHVVASMCFLAKKLGVADKALRAGVFARPGSLPGLVSKLGYTALELDGKVLGLVGFGRIARLVAAKCRHGFGMRVLAYDAYVAPEVMEAAGVEACANLDDVFGRSDFVSIHVPLTPETRGMVGRRQLELMRPSAFLIHTARGGVVAEDDLVSVLQDGLIAGAAVDVFVEEPPSPDHPLFGLDNVLVTPHMAAMTDGALVRMAVDVAAGVVDALQGKRPQYLVNPEVWNRDPGA